MKRPDVILIAGPTASGKSSFAIELAERWDGEIVNTDSMQVYPVLRVLTARPSEEDILRVPHHLYGTAPIGEPYSVARWLEEAMLVADDIIERGRVPVFVGGTGLYFRALEQSLAGTPHIPDALREAIRGDLVRHGSQALHARLAELDPLAAEKLRPTDSHRIARALEVVEATGKSLLAFQNLPVSTPYLADKLCEKHVLMPPRPLLHERINTRTEKMFEQGAVAEVEALLALELPPQATVLKAIGVKQVASFIYGEQSLNDSIFQVKAATRQYAKRQSTWFRGQFGTDWGLSDPPNA